MSTIKERKNKKGISVFTAQIRIKGAPYLQSTFTNRKEAEDWAKFTEDSIRNPETNMNPIVSIAFDRYRMEILPTKSLSAQSDEKVHLEFWENELKNYHLQDLKPLLIENTANKIYEKISRITKKPLTYESRRKYLATLSYFFSVAVKKWRWIEFNPVFFVNKHVPSKKKPKDTVLINITCPLRKVLLDEVKRIMDEKELTVSSLAYQMKIAKSTLQSFFDPKSNITINMCVKVVKALGKEVDFVFKD